jgi:hypothetical protein
MPRRSAHHRPIRVRMLAVSAGLLLATFGAPALPAHAIDIPEWPDFSWGECVDDAAQYCVQEATVTPVDGVATPVAELGLHAGVNTLGGAARSFNWSVEGWEGADVPEEVRGGDVNLVIRTGQFVPRYTIALANSMRITRQTDDAGNTTIAITGHAVQIDWTTGDLFGACISGSNCGGPDTMADPIGTGFRFMGNTQDMETWGEDAMNRYDGMYIASDAQARPTTVEFWGGEDPYWSLQTLGNPHLDVNGNPVRGSFNAWVPPSYFAASGTTAEAAAEVGFDVVSHEGETATSVPATVAVQDGGVALSVADIGYSMHRIDVFNRPSEVAPDATTPGAPEGIGVQPGAGTAAATWSAPAGDGGSAVTGYTARAFTAPTGGTVAGRCTAGAGDTACTIAKLESGTTYYVAVSATNALGEGPAGERESVTPVVPVSTPPSAPTELVVTPGNTTLAATWTAPTSDGGSPVTAYTVRAYTEPGAGTGPNAGTKSSASTKATVNLSTGPGTSPVDGTVVKTCTAIAPALSCTITGLTNGRAYYVSVTAANTVGAGPATIRVAGTPRTTPSAVPGLTLVPGNRSLAASWAVPTNNGGAPVVGYTVKAYPTAVGGAPVRTCSATAPVRTCTLADLTGGTPYFVTVIASNVAGYGPDGVRVSGTPTGTPSAVPAPTVTPGNNTLAVTWTPPASTGGKPITSYTVRAYLGDAGGVPVKTCTASAGSRSCSLGGLTAGTTYYVTVTAANSNGAGPESSRVVAAPRTVATAPRSVLTTVLTNKIRAEWLEPASNGGTPITGYRVNVYATPNAVGSPIASCNVAAVVHTCTTSALATGRTYYVTVVATNAVGASPASPVIAVLVARR